MARKFLFTMAALAGFCLPAAAIASQQAFTTGNLSVRVGPDTDYARIAVIPEGDQLTVFGCVSGYLWCDIEWAGLRGWVYADYLGFLGDNRRYDWRTYAPRNDFPIITFSFGDYNDRWYRDRPWYRHRSWNNDWNDRWDRDRGRWWNNDHSRRDARRRDNDHNDRRVIRKPDNDHNDRRVIRKPDNDHNDRRVIRKPDNDHNDRRVIRKPDNGSKARRTNNNHRDARKSNDNKKRKTSKDDDNKRGAQQGGHRGQPGLLNSQGKTPY